MSHTRILVVELAKLAGGLAAEVVHRGLNALVPSPAERRAGVLAVLEPTVCNGYSPADILNQMTAEAAADGMYQRVNGFISTRSGCGKEAIPSRLVAEELFPSGQPADDFPEPLGEYPDVDPRAVITGGRHDWLVGGTISGRMGVVFPQSSAGHSPLSADTAPSPSEPAPPLVGSGHPNLTDAVARVLFEVWIGDTTLWPKLPDHRRDAWRPYADALLENFKVTPK